MVMMDTPPATELVAIEINDSGCHIKLDREDKFHALNVQMITELCTLFDWTAQRSV